MEGNQPVFQVLVFVVIGKFNCVNCQTNFISRIQQKQRSILEKPPWLFA